MSSGASHVTVARFAPGVAATPTGTPGTVLGVIDAEAFDAGPGPTALKACTVNL